MRTPPRWRTEGERVERRSERSAVAVVLVVLGMVGALVGPAPAALAQGATTDATDDPEPIDETKPDPKTGAGGGRTAPLASSELRELMASAGAGLGRVTDSVTVEVLADDTAAAAAAVEELGGKVDGEVAGWLVQARMPVASLAALEARDPVRTVRLPALAAPPPPIEPASAQASLAQAVTQADAAEWHSAGFTGTGVRVGIIDYFNLDDWNRAIVSGDLPAPAGTFCRFEGTSCTVWLPRTEGTGHGVAVAEVVADMAPDAELYLATVGTTADLQAAVDWFAANGVDVVSRSLTSEYDGPGDGTGPIAAVIDDAVAQGMAWFNAAGNGASDASRDAGDYWRGPWNDPDGDGWLDFTPGDEDLGFRCGFLNGVRWNDWGDPAATDYDVYVYEQPGQGGVLIESSRDTQPVADPVELLSICPKDGNGNPITAYLRVRLYDPGGGTAGDVIEFMLNQGAVEHWSNPYSASGPAVDTASPGAMAVGAIDPAGGDTIAWYSSRGPTNDGRVKPDMVAQSCLDTNTYLVGYGSCFNGTSAATPVVAGAAALVRQSGLAATPAALVSWLRTKARVDRGPAGPDNTYGVGELLLPPPPARNCPPDDAGDLGGGDDTRLTATTVASGVTTTAVACDDDWYAMDLAVGDVLRVDLDFRHEAGNLDLGVFGPAGALVKSATSTTDDELAVHTASVPGTHTVRVHPSGGGEENGYRLTLTSDGACPPDDVHEPNDTRVAARPVVDGIVTVGLACAGDPDWYSLPVSAGENIVASLDFAHAAGNIDLALFDPSGNLVSNAATSTDDESLSFVATTSGTWTVRVTGNSNAYRLIVTTGGVCPPDDGNEPNDSRGAAKPVRDGVTIAGIACDDDWYRIDVDAGQGITAQLDFAHDGGDLDMTLTDPSGTVVGYGLSISDGETITHVAGQSGTYAVRVYGYLGAENEYDLTVSLGSVDPCAANPIQPFFDVSPTSYAWEAIACIFALGITTGTSPTTYAPTEPVTREQMAAFLARTYTAVHGSRAPVVSTPFTDVSPTSFARDDIARIYGLGITTGTSPTTYAPTEPVTREQMAAFLARLYAVLISTV